MTKKEVMVSAIRTAMANGFKRDVGEKSIELIETGAINFGSAEGMLIVRGLLTEHRFARALWGSSWDDLPKGAEESPLYKPRWEVELQMLVVAKDPIRYLETTL